MPLKTTHPFFFGNSIARPDPEAHIVVAVVRIVPVAVRHAAKRRIVVPRPPADDEALSPFALFFKKIFGFAEKCRATKVKKRLLRSLKRVKV
jgi:hypothetical protein